MTGFARGPPAVVFSGRKCLRWRLRGELPVETQREGELMRKYPWRLMLAGFLFSCGGVTKEPVPDTATQPEAAGCPQEGDACEIEDPYGKASDTCLPAKTGLHC